MIWVGEASSGVGDAIVEGAGSRVPRAPITAGKQVDTAAPLDPAHQTRPSSRHSLDVATATPSLPLFRMTRLAHRLLRFASINSLARRSYYGEQAG